MTKKRANLMTRFGVSAVGVVVLLAFLAALNVLVDGVNLRWDLTEGKIYTLSDSTRRILSELDDTVTVRFYYSRDTEGIPVPLKTYAGRVEDMLREYEIVADGKLEIEKLNPLPDSDAEDAALMDGIQRQSARGGAPFYLGLAVIYLDEVISMATLSPARANLFEFDLTRAIHRVLNPEKRKIGVLTTLPVNGPIIDPNDPRTMRRVEAREPWFFMENLKQDYDVEMLDWTLKQVPDDIDVLLVIHPKSSDPRVQFAIDQFVLRGGRVLMFLDPFNLYEQMQNRVPGRPPSTSAAMNPLMDAWGLEFQPGQVLADMNYRSRVPDGENGVQEFPAVLALTASAMNSADVTTTQLDGLIIPYGGVVQGEGAEGLERTVLISSSTESQLVDAFGIHGRGDDVVDEFEASGINMPMAVKLTGMFPTAFPDGRPEVEIPDDDQEDEASEADSKPALKLAQAPGAVVVVADADFLYDAVSVQRGNVLGQQVVRMISDNLYLLGNLVEQLAGGDALIGLRSRETGYRPFKRLEKSRDEAAEQYRDRIKDLETMLADTQQRLRELQVQKTREGRLELTPEQKKLIAEAQEKEVGIRQELKELRRTYRASERRLEWWLEFGNIALVPILVALVGIGVGILRIRRTSLS